MLFRTNHLNTNQKRRAFKKMYLQAEKIYVLHTFERSILNNVPC